MDRLRIGERRVAVCPECKSETITESDGWWVLECDDCGAGFHHADERRLARDDESGTIGSNHI